MSYHSRNYGGSSGDWGWGSIIACIFAIIFLPMISRSCSRDYSNMIYLGDGYCYHEDTRIIYIESLEGKYDSDTSYTPYYDSDGHKARYNVETGEWEVVVE